MALGNRRGGVARDGRQGAGPPANIGLAKVAEFIVEQTRDHGFASEQLTALFGQVEHRQVDPRVDLLDPEGPSRGRTAPADLSITEARISKGVDFWNTAGSDQPAG